MSKRGSTRVRLAVAAAVIAGGGAAGAVALTVSHSASATAESAGFSRTTHGRTMSYTSAMSSAMKEWSNSPGEALSTISHMQTVHNYWTQSWHKATIFIQRGTVLAVARGEFAVKSTDGKIEIWHVNGKTQVMNVGGTTTGMSAMTGGTMNVPSWWNMNTRVKGIARGDLVFVFGERENHTLKAQLVLFAAPTTTVVTPTVTPTATMPATTTPTAIPTTTTPAMTTPAVAPSAIASTFSGVKS
jgi:hypothetical protein